MKKSLEFVAGQTFGQWEVIERRGGSVRCRCSCGGVYDVLRENLTRKNRPSRRCRPCSRVGNTNSRAGNHEIDPKLYRRLSTTVNNAIRRCTEPDRKQWKDYGGRGIKVYQPWVDDPSKFVKYLTTLQGYDDPELIIDRIENDSGYEPGNLKFVTRSASNINRRPFGHLLKKDTKGKFART